MLGDSLPLFYYKVRYVVVGFISTDNYYSFREDIYDELCTDLRYQLDKELIAEAGYDR